MRECEDLVWVVRGSVGTEQPVDCVGVVESVGVVEGVRSEVMLSDVDW